ncbi:MAG: DUF4190 domain-containing protein [Pirellulales bacterium]|nr:DUF4190 domain-containing protein [Pirellulales bacterium]
MALFQESATITEKPPPTYYRAIDPLAVFSVVFGGLSILTALNVWLSAIPLVGVALGLLSRRRISRAPDTLTGRGMAKLGISLSLALWLAGCGLLLYRGQSEIPYGYTEIDYDVLQPDPAHPTMSVPQVALDMRDKKVFIRGYIQARRQQMHIKEFILCPIQGSCPFCTPNPKPTEMIRVTLVGDLETNYTTHLIGVAGRFQVQPDDISGIPYAIEAEILR